MPQPNGQPTPDEVKAALSNPNATALATPPPVTRYTTPPSTPTPSAGVYSGANGAPNLPGTPGYVPPTTTTPTTDANGAPTLGTVDENAIRTKVADQMQSQIDAINAQYADLINTENTNGEERSGETRATSARSGTLGSDFGDAAATKTQQFNASQVKALQDEQAAKVAAVQQGIEDRASAAIEAAKTDALNKYNVDKTSYAASQAAAKADLQTLATSGTPLSSLSPDQKAALLKQAGYNDTAMGEIVYNAMLPKASQIDYKSENLGNGQVLFYGIDPTTGQLKTQKVSMDVPASWKVTVAPDGTLIQYDDQGNARIAPGTSRGEFGKPDPTSSTDAHTAAFNTYDQIFTEGSKADNLLANGQDGYANPATYNKLRADAISKGYSANDFDSQFKSYVNPADPQDYEGVGGKK